MMTPNEEIAKESAAEFFMLLRNWTGFDARQFHQQRLTEIIFQAMQKSKDAENKRMLEILANMDENEWDD